MTYRWIVGEKESEQDRIREILRDNPKGLTIEEVSRKLGLNRSTAAKYLNSLVVSGQAEMRNLGPAKLFYLTQRLPLTNLLSLASDLIIVLDNDLFIQEVNDPFLAFFRLSKDQLKGQKIEHSPVAAIFSAEHMTAIRNALEGSEIVLEAGFAIGDDERYFKCKFIPLVFEGGERAAGVIMEDISEMMKYQHELEERVRLRTAALLKTNDSLEKEIQERNRIEDALIRNEARLRRAEGVARFGNWEFHIENGTMTGSDGARALYGLSGPDWEIGIVQSIPLPEYRPLLDEALRNLIEHNRPYDIEFEIRRPADNSVIAIRSIAEYDPEKKVVFGVIHDITDRKRAEEAIRKATRQILLLTSVTRHDILNQLNTLSGYLGMTRNLTGDIQILGMVMREQQIAEIIRRQITFTRDYQNIGMQPPQWNNVSTTISKVLETTDLGSIEVSVQTANLEIFTDSLIEKVYYNLFDNSIRHGKDVSQICVSFRRDGDEGILLFEDNGCGVPDDEKEQIFERGYGQNTGYGLFLVKEILAITGLTIRETGVSGSGARFEIHIPAGEFRITP